MVISLKRSVFKSMLIFFFLRALKKYLTLFKCKILKRSKFYIGYRKIKGNDGSRRLNHGNAKFLLNAMR